MQPEAETGDRSRAYEAALKELAQIISSESKLTTKKLIQHQKLISKRYGLNKLIGLRQLINTLPQEDLKGLSRLKIKPIRTASGIAVVAVMAAPHPCPHGVCIYCPGGVSKGTPQSYTGFEPSSRRAKENLYDPYLQVNARLKQLKQIGHTVDKVELVIIGGTFTSLPEEEQIRFVKGCFDALNGKPSQTLKEALSEAEHAKIRNVGFTVETRPDYCKEKHIDFMLSYGVTRVEIGVQTLDDEIYRFINRGHSVKDVAEAFQAARDSGLKIVAHMMPGLPKSDIEKDLQHFKMLFEDPRFKPDMLKIYPTVVTEGTYIHKLYLKGEYKPYDLNEVVDLLSAVKKMVPPWIRIMRIQREIPAGQIVAGVKNGNLREIVQQEMRRMGVRCRCIRCREVGLKNIRINDSEIKLLREEYEASEGVEIFLSYEHPLTDTLLGFLRLRIPSNKAHREEVKNDRTALVRELHVYGEALPLGIRKENAWQHRGFGKKLLYEAENIARGVYDCRKILVTSAVGVRQYYVRQGYRLEGTYMAKQLNH
ncbi:MAG: tRNA uridine(34) 5-carboxymethylaminomethyl modification radical SAM/GNAT enzyme Elp3 [Nitrososphaerales archaeon]